MGKLVKIRGNPYKEFMTDYTQDGRKYTQSLTRAVLVKEAELVQELRMVTRNIEM